MELQNRKDGSEEFIIVDYDAPFSISEYDSVSELAEIAEKLAELTDDEIEVLEVIMENYTDNFNEALEKVIDGDYVLYYDCPDMTAVAEAYCEDCGILNSISENLRYYFDFEAF